MFVKVKCIDGGKTSALYEANNLMDKEFKRMGKPGRRALFPDLEQNYDSNC